MTTTTPSTLAPAPAQSMVLPSGPLVTFAIRLKPGDDLVLNILRFVKQAMAQSDSQSAFILSVVGSLECVTLRMANTGKRVADSMGRVDDEGSNCPTTEHTAKTMKTTSSSNEIRQWNERLEIVSFVGTFDKDGGFHLHMSVSDAKGQVFGGHLIAGKIFTTLELVIGCTPGIKFTRTLDDGPNGTGFNELVVDHQSQQQA